MRPSSPDTSHARAESSSDDEAHHSLPADAETAAAPQRPRFDRGPRPLLRGILHERSVWAFIGSSIPLVVVTARIHATGVVTWMTTLYALCLIGSMSVSALYHLGAWRTESAVLKWRRADHAMIAVFIAGTYGPVAVVALQPDRAILLLSLCWTGALLAVLLNLCWVNHPRWMGVSVYLILGWLVIWEVPSLWTGLGPAVTLLLGAGGLVYTFGALVYALKWPNPSLRFFGFHEVFHATTIVAAALHHIAIWMSVAL
ncbi:PAQR family membrane homeostasis protein TrhA [Corynebacterium mayonis]|uniref:PAQR family membrane homeostasis protein TrhA n=1 Tax=Corynebacterium mayonis TaxID=3062461 RepID=UPI0031400A82